MEISKSDLAAFPRAQRKAIAFLCAVISSHSEVDSARLPSTKQLASAAKVSFRTMWKAVDELRKRGLVECYPGHGIFLKPDAAGDAATTHDAKVSVERPLVRGVWRRTAARMAADIFTNVYKPGAPLPAGKELQRIYGVSFVTLHKCLASLLDEGLIVPHGSSFMVKPLSPRRGTLRIVVIHPFDQHWRVKRIGFSEERFYEVFLRNLEEMCSRSAIALQVIYRVYENDSAAFYDLATNEPYDFTRNDDVMGYISEVMMLQAEYLEHEMVLLASLKKPVAVFNPGDDRLLTKRVSGNRLLRAFRIASDQECGRDAARLLLSMGHRRIAFFSPWHGADWSQGRLLGIEKTYEDAGYAAAVGSFVLNDFRRRGAIFGAVAAQCRPDAWVAGYQSWAKTVPAEFAASLDPVIKYAAYDGVIRGEIYRCMKPLFEDALEDPSITAWICANDMTGLIALDFLDRCGKSVPRDLSLVSFDDSLDALNARLDSYNFDIPALVNAMLRHVMQHRQMARFQPGRTVLIPGHIVMRGSVAEVHS